MKVFIGIVGQIGSGKGVLSNYLMRKFGFTSFSFSSIVHEELRKKGTTSFTRETLQDIGDDLRKKYGDDVLAKRAIDKIRNSNIESRNNFQNNNSQNSKHLDIFNLKHSNLSRISDFEIILLRGYEIRER